MLEEILLVRHGQSKSNIREESPHSHGDHAVGLTDFGVTQAKAVGASFAPIVHDPRTLLYCSPYTRTRETMRSLLDGAYENTSPKPSRTVYEDPRLREVEHGYGTFEDCERQENLRRRHGWFYYRFLGGESPADCYDRCSTFIDSMFRQVERKSASRVLIVSHGLTIRCLVMRLLHLSVEDFDSMANPENASVVRVVRDTWMTNPVFERGSWSVHDMKLRSDEQKREHCFHATGLGTWISNAICREEKCCHCGTGRSVVDEPEVDVTHGPHVNVTVPKTRIVMPPTEIVCIPKPR